MKRFSMIGLIAAFGIRSALATAWQCSSGWGTKFLTLLLLLTPATMLEAQFSYTNLTNLAEGRR